MKRVLLTVMSGTGKSTVINKLGALGYKVVDTDYGGFTVEVDSGSGRPSDHLKYQYDDSEKLRIRIERTSAIRSAKLTSTLPLLQHIQPVAASICWTLAVVLVSSMAYSRCTAYGSAVSTCRLAGCARQPMTTCAALHPSHSFGASTELPHRHAVRRSRQLAADAVDRARLTRCSRRPGDRRHTRPRRGAQIVGRARSLAASPQQLTESAGEPGTPLLQLLDQLWRAHHFEF